MAAVQSPRPVRATRSYSTETTMTTTHTSRMFESGQATTLYLRYPARS
jgi:hypothetical protein